MTASTRSATEPHAKEIAEAVLHLENCFNKIHQQRMQGIPILNDSLHVSGVGFHPWQGFWLGVLITPWFINLVLLPATKTTVNLPGIGKKFTLALPSGKFTFITAYEEEIGSFLACSLISPVTEIATQALAQETAEEVLLAIMDPQHSDGSGDINNQEIERIWRGEQLVDKPGELSQSDEFSEPNELTQTDKPSKTNKIPQANEPATAEPELDSPSRRELFSRLIPSSTSKPVASKPTTSIKVASNDGENQQ